MHRIGRDLIRCGESVHLIETDRGLRLSPVAAFDVLAGWRYAIEIPMPPGKVLKRTVARGGVLHVMWATDGREPWRGVSPMAAASGLAKLMAATESKLGEDLATPTAHLLPIPDDYDDTQLLRADIGAARGKALLVETTAADPRGAPRKDWVSERLGPEIPTELRAFYGDVSDHVFSVCGIPVSLSGVGDADGTQLREDYRRFVMASVEPVAGMISEAASEALEVDVRFDFSGLWAHDLTGRASAYAKLVTAGMDADRAAALSGLLVDG